jgi:5-methylcytosine-specific restriction endonuclease McrA
MAEEKSEQDDRTTAPGNNKKECRICGENRKEEQIEEHHLVPKRHGGADTNANLVQVCANCHKTLEAVYDSDFWDRVRWNDELDSPIEAPWNAGDNDE